MKGVLIVLAISGVAAVVNLACAALAYNTARDLRSRLNNDCTCTPIGLVQDCDMKSASNTGNVSTLVSLLSSIVGLILILITFAVSANPHK